MKKLLFILPPVILLLICSMGLGLVPGPALGAEAWGIDRVVSPQDADGDGTDDFTDIMLGARAEALNMPTYRSAYYDGGYPPDNEGVCADVIWRAFRDAGYDLKAMIDKDIAENNDEYPSASPRDPNIDFRRVRNLIVFFERHAESLTTDIFRVSQWQPGDIVVFGERYTHIGIVSDKRSIFGIPYLIHNAGQENRDENALFRWDLSTKIVGHYRWNQTY